MFEHVHLVIPALTDQLEECDPWDEKSASHMKVEEKISKLDRLRPLVDVSPYCTVSAMFNVWLFTAAPLLE